MDAGKLSSLEAAALRSRLLAIETAPSHTDGDTPDSQARALFERALAGANDGGRAADRTASAPPAPAAPAVPPPAMTVHLSQAAVAASKNPELAAILSLVREHSQSARSAGRDPAPELAASRADGAAPAANRPELAFAAAFAATAGGPASTKAAETPAVETVEPAARWPAGELMVRALAPASEPGANYLNWVMVVAAVLGVLVLVLT